MLYQNDTRLLSGRSLMFQTVCMACWAFCEFPLADHNDRSKVLHCPHCGAELPRKIGRRTPPEQLKRYNERMAEEMARIDAPFLEMFKKSQAAQDAAWNAPLLKHQAETGEDMRPYLRDRITPWKQLPDGTWIQDPSGTESRPVWAMRYVGDGRWDRDVVLACTSCWTAYRAPERDHLRPRRCPNCGAIHRFPSAFNPLTPEQQQRYDALLDDERYRMVDEHHNAPLRKFQEITGQDMRGRMIDHVTPWNELPDGSWVQAPDGTFRPTPRGSYPFSYIGDGRWHRLTPEELERQRLCGPHR